MRVRRILHVAFLAAVCAISSCQGQQRIFCFVQKELKWERTPHGYYTTTGGVVLLSEDHKFMEVISTLYRDPNNHLTMDSKLGYVVFTGTWKPKSPDEITIAYRLADSFKFMIRGQDNQRTASWHLAGPNLGPIRRSLRDESTEFEFNDFLGRDKVVQNFWGRYVEARSR